MIGCLPGVTAIAESSVEACALTLRSQLTSMPSSLSGVLCEMASRWSSGTLTNRIKRCTHREGNDMDVCTPTAEWRDSLSRMLAISPTKFYVRYRGGCWSTSKLAQRRSTGGADCGILVTSQDERHLKQQRTPNNIDKREFLHNRITWKQFSIRIQIWTTCASFAG